MASNEDQDAFPTSIYHLDHPAQLVKSTAELSALPDATGWSYAPFVTREMPQVSPNITDAMIAARPKVTKIDGGTIVVRPVSPAAVVADPSNNHKAKKDR